jgi:uncharacterized protein
LTAANRHVAADLATADGMHPAPWPLLTLDVSAVLAAGHRPAPFRQFIVKVHSRCNLSCTYCYVYEMADQGWRSLPKRMSSGTANAAVERIAEHVKEHDLAQLDVILHGGEPLLAGRNWLARFVETLHVHVPAQVDVTMQTNGILLDRSTLETFAELGIRIGVSLDGDAKTTARHRRYANGHSSYEAVVEGVELLNSPAFRSCYAGLLCTIAIDSDPVLTYESLLRFSPPVIDFLLPHANWDSLPPGTGYADWLIAVFDRWYDAPWQGTDIRLFRELIQLVLGQASGVEGVGIAPSTIVVIDTDGAIKQLDSLSSAYPGAADTGLDVYANSFDEALNHPTTVARQIGDAALAADCLACPVLELCGGGLYPHRFRHGTGFRHPSVYCRDLLRLTTHVRDRVHADLGRMTGIPKFTPMARSPR